MFVTQADDSPVTIQTKASEQYFPMARFIMLCKMVLTFELVDEILKCDHSNESHWAVLSCGAVYYAVPGGLASHADVPRGLSPPERLRGRLQVVLTC